jgi:hypothetical protein
VTELERGTNDLGTPKWLLDRVRALGPIVFDPCSNPWSNVDALFSASAHDGEDGLSISWREVIDTLGPGLVYANPPYGNGPPEEGKKKGRPLLPAWSSKIVEEAQAACEIITCVPLAPDTAWWRAQRDACNAHCAIERRVAFEGGAHGTGQIRSSVFYFGPQRFLFCHVFEDVGEVRPYDTRRPA